MATERVVLIRCPADSGRDAQIMNLLSRWRTQPGRMLLFFQGPGLAHVRPDSPFASLAAPDTTLMVCSGGWRRRGHAEPAAPFLLGSLIQFWAAAAEADEVASFGTVGS